VQHRGQAAHELSHVNHHPLGLGPPRTAAPPRPPRKRVAGASQQEGFLVMGGWQSPRGVHLAGSSRRMRSTAHTNDRRGQNAPLPSGGPSVPYAVPASYGQSGQLSSLANRAHLLPGGCQGEDHDLLVLDQRLKHLQRRFRASSGKGDWQQHMGQYSTTLQEAAATRAVLSCAGASMHRAQGARCSQHTQHTQRTCRSRATAAW
jgi:hypothetical protein